MQKIFDASEKLFFNILIICLISCIYFNIFPKNIFTIAIGLIFAIAYFGTNFYVGYLNSLSIKESLIVGVVGSFIGIFLGFFAVYTYYVLNSPEKALMIVMPYFSPTTSVVNLFLKNVSISYPFILMFINIILVIIGSISKKIVNKFL